MKNNRNRKYPHAVHGILKELGMRGQIELIPICNGGNNRAWKLKIDHCPFFLKEYFYSKEDTRDRLGTEFSFSLFAWENNVRSIPEPIAADRINQLGLFSYISGRKIKADEIDNDLLNKVIDFLNQLNHRRNTLRGQSFVFSSDNCFSLQDHLNSFEKRYLRVSSITPHDDIDREAKEFIDKIIKIRWELLKSEIDQSAKDAGIKLDQRVDRGGVILSPSDLGFHNMILNEQGTLFFMDFEYAGWDDPIKLICDFFTQPEVPVPITYFDGFVEKISAILQTGDSGYDKLLIQSKLIIPLYRLKWCLIMLNDFIACDWERKKFASFGKDKRKIQLNKAINYLKESEYGLY